MTVLPPTPFRLYVSPWDVEGLIVSQLSAKEALSQPYAVDLVAFVPAPLALDDLPPIGTPATLAFAASEMESHASRRFHGIISRITHDGTAHDRSGTWLRARISPRLWLAKHARARRIFQGRNVLAILDAVLGAHRIPWRWSIDTQPQVMGYCVQYDETDFAFVHRLLSRLGLFYYFDQGTAEPGDEGAHETLVICDTARHYPAIGEVQGQPRVLKLVDRHGTYRPVESVLAFAFGRRGRPTTTRLREWDHRSPLAPAEESETVTTERALGTDALIVDEFEQRGGHDMTRVRRRDARGALEQRRADVAVGTGSSDCPGMAPGHRFFLNNHDVGHLNILWVLTEVTHEGRVPEYAREGRPARGGPPPVAVYVNHFSCTPADVTVRPPRPTPRHAPATETAIVVGPEGEDIHTDEFGRIRVRFHWDREAPNDHNSCWMRVAQAWAGSGFGVQFIPRIGMEVVVTYLGGDPDNPVVIGCLSNAMHLPAEALPDAKTRSGIRTQSTPGGDGYNELTFQDDTGNEEIRLHAQRDLAETVRRDHTAVVGSNQAITVVAQRAVTVGGDERHAVAGGLTEEVGGSVRTTIGQAHTLEIARTSREQVGETKTIAIGGERHVTVAGAATDTFVQNLAVRVEGSFSSVIGSASEPHGASVFSHDAYTIGAQESLRLSSHTSIVLRCGTSTIEITPDTIRLHAQHIEVSGTETASIAANGPLVRLTDKAEVLADTIQLFASSASIDLHQDAKVRGTKVKLNCDDGNASQDGQQQNARPHELALRLANELHEPYRNCQYHLVADGRRIEGTTDGDGIVRQRLPGHITSAELTLWPEHYPTGRHLNWTLALQAQQLPPANTPRGAHARLTNLGHRCGAASDAITSEIADALRRFQASHGLQVTGDLSAETASALARRAGL